MNRLLLYGLISCCFCFATGAASAQTPPGCSYDQCALRVIDGGGYFALPYVVQGLEGYAVSTVRRSDALQRLFATNDAAAAHYARFKTHDRYADWFGWVGTGLIISGFIGDLAGGGGLFSRTYLLYGAGMAVTWGVALPAERRAATDLSNAIWWYNRSLVPSP